MNKQILSRPLKLGAAVLLALAGAATVAPAHAGPVYVDIRVAPPAPRYEVVPAPRAGYVWVPGYWDWRSNRHVWVNGRWLAERRGYTYVQPVWVQEGPRWVHRPGGWNRHDRDRDGIPNRYDRDRDGDGIPNRYDHNNRGRGHDRDRDGIPNRVDRDRDGDGVPNRHDRRPDNGHRR